MNLEHLRFLPLLDSGGGGGGGGGDPETDDDYRLQHGPKENDGAGAYAGQNVGSGDDGGGLLGDYIKLSLKKKWEPPKDDQVYLAWGDDAKGRRRPQYAYRRHWVGGEDGHWEEEKLQDFSGVNEYVGKAQDIETPQYEDWLVQHGYQLNDINLDPVQQLLNEIMNADDMGDAGEYAAKYLGYESAEDMRNKLGLKMQQLDQGIAGQQGLSRQEMEQRQRLNQNIVSQQERFARESLDTVAAGGASTAKFLMLSDQYSAQIANTRLQAADQLAKENYERKVSEWTAQKELYDSQLAAGQISIQEYIDARNQNRAQALGAYAASITTAVTENAQYLEMYQADMQSLQQSIANYYQAALMELGVSSAEIQLASDIYMQSIQEWLVQMQQQALDNQSQAMANARAGQAAGNVMAGLGALASIITAIAAL